ncbi:hypothetical protein [Ferruginibacter sp.]|nr:hypothetical protein [Ferruginibacter sp.]
MKNILNIIIAIPIFFITSCEKEKNVGQWNIKIEDGAEVYHYTGVNYNPLTADGMSAAFNSTASFGSSGSTIIYNTGSEFVVRLGNISKIVFTLNFNTYDSAIVSGLKQSNSNIVRFNAFKQVVKKGVYQFNNAAVTPFIVYVDKNGVLWSTDFLQASFLEVVSVTPNTQDNTANALITQINFDIGLKSISNTSLKRIKGSVFSFFNLD